MQHFPIFLALTGRRVVLSGAGEAALAKLRLLLKTEARLQVFGTDPDPQLRTWHAEGRIHLTERALQAGDVAGDVMGDLGGTVAQDDTGGSDTAAAAILFYAANEDDAEDARVAALARAEGALVNVVDNLEASAFITPAIVDRDPVTIAIGTEGAAPVLARAIKRDLEERLPVRLGLMARIGKLFRAKADALPMGRPRRDFWADYYFNAGPKTPEATGEDGLNTTLDGLLAQHLSRTQTPGHVAFVGAGPGDPELLTLRARRALDEADVILHDRLVPKEILELARREAVLVETGKTGFGPAMAQSEIDALIVEHAQTGAQVVRLKSGDPTVFGRLDEEIAAVEAAGIAFSIVPGITAASAAAAQIGQSLTARGRNSELRLLTGHDVKGFADQEWRALARPGTVAAIYMGKRAARFLQGRLLMHGAASDTPVAVVENASRPDSRVIGSSLGVLPDTLSAVGLDGPAVMLLGLSPRAAQTALPELSALAELTQSSAHLKEQA